MQDKEPHYSDAVIQAVDSGHKIEAIKRLREETGLGLKEAKNAVDSLAQQRQPDGASLPEQGGAGAIVKIVIAIGVLYLVYRFLVAA